MHTVFLLDWLLSLSVSVTTLHKYLLYYYIKKLLYDTRRVFQDTHIMNSVTERTDDVQIFQMMNIHFASLCQSKWQCTRLAASGASGTHAKITCLQTSTPWHGIESGWEMHGQFGVLCKPVVAKKN